LLAKICRVPTLSLPPTGKEFASNLALHDRSTVPLNSSVNSLSHPTNSQSAIAPVFESGKSMSDFLSALFLYGAWSNDKKCAAY